MKLNNTKKMKVFKKYSIITRSLIIILLGIIFYVATINFLGTATSPTDENLFADPLSRFYLTEELDVVDSTGNKSGIQIKPGSLVLSIGNHKLVDSKDLNVILNNFNKNKLISILTFDPYKKESIEALIKFDEIKNGTFLYLPSVVFVVDVIEGGASDRAGMLEGDLIIRINGQEFKNMFEADRLLQKTSTGQATTYDVLRKNKLVSLELIPVKIGFPIVQILQHITALLFIILGSFIVLKRPKITAALILGLGLILLGSFYTISLGRINLFTGLNFFSIIRSALLYISIHFGIALLIHSTFYFPYKNSIADKSWLKWYLYGYATITVIASLINLLFFRLQLFNIINNFIIISVLISFVVIRFILKKEYNREYKEANKLIFIFFSSSIILRFVLPFASEISKFLTIDLNYLLVLFNFLLVWSYYYTIAKHGLLDLNLRIKRNIQYAFISVLWRFLAVVILIFILYCISKIEIDFPNIHLHGTYLEILKNPLSSEIQRIYENIFLIVVSIVTTIIWWKFKKFIQHILDKKYHRTSFDYRKATSDLSKFLINNFSLDDLTKNVVNELADLTHIKKIGLIIFKNEDKVVSQNYYGLKTNDLSELIPFSVPNMVSAIQEHRDDFRVEYLPVPYRNILNDYGFLFIQPIYSKSKLLGILLIGEKMSEAPFNKDDFEFLNTISGQISVAVENAFLYEDLTQQERFKHELSIARKIQLASLPDSIPNIQGLEISGISLPALEVGGDFYDFLETDNDDFMVIIGDVSGKGTSAALYMSKIQGIMRTLHQFRLSPRKLLIQTNKLIYKYLEKGYFISATSINFNINKRQVTVARAGHLPLFLFRSKSNELQKIINNGIVLGLTKDKTFERNLDEIDIEFFEGDFFVLFTDGIIEAKNKIMQEFSEERLVQIIKNNSNLTAEGLRDLIIKSVNEFVDSASQYDDMTVVVVKVN